MAVEAFETAAGVVGNVLEWYDFALYGFFSDTLGHVFFPPSDPGGHRNLIYSYLVFGGAFLMRPLGGGVTGHIGDKHGRKRALVFSLFTMWVPTVAMGILPTYDQVGGWSTALLVACRLVQGFSVGGQLPSSVVYTLERKPKQHWGYYGAIVNAASNIGVILGNLVGALLRMLLTDDQLVRWGWRAAFVSGIIILPIAIFLRLYGREHNPNEGEYDLDDDVDEPIESKETVAIAGLAPSQSTHPLGESVKRENWAALCSATLVPMFAGGGYYVSVVWMAIFMETLVKPPVNGAFWVNLAANCVGLTLTAFFAGWLSDHCGRVGLMAFGAIAAGAIAPVMTWIISRGDTVEALFAQMLLCFCLAFYWGPMNAWLVEKFPPRIRLTSMSLGFNMGICLSSGFSPALATALVRLSNFAPGFIFTVLAVFGLIGMCIFPKVHQDGGVHSDSDSIGDANVPTDDVSEDLSAHLL